MHDLVIRNGTVIDGTGKPGRCADVAITDGIITDVIPQTGLARRDVDAEGRLVLPGWVDIHTHYDGQATWDAAMTPSSWHGVTTTIFGNCGVGFAPVRPGTEHFLINLMEGVEDIPEIVLAEGVDFRWESFNEYLDVLDETPRVMDIGAQVAHSALRFYVMGDRGADHDARPTEDEITRMGELLEESLAGGAFGFTTSRTGKHRAADGRPTPSLTAEHAELAGLALAMKRAGTGIIQVNSDFGAGEFQLLRAVAELAERPLSVLLVQMAIAPERWAQTLASVDEACADGLEFTAQVGSRAIGILLGLQASQHPFLTHPLWHELQTVDHKTRVDRLVNSSELRSRLVKDRPDDDHTREMTNILEQTFELGDPLNYEPKFEDSIASRAVKAHRDPFDLALELLLQDGGQKLLMHTFENYCEGDLNVVYRMLVNPNTVCGIADGGAHVGLICDSSSPTSLLTHWARDRIRGPQLPLEFLVHKQTAATARTYGLHDRGVIAPGYRADINIIDFNELRLQPPVVVHDLPAGGKRIVQRPKGYRHTFVHGIEVAHNGEDTGARPGRLLRGCQAGPGGRKLGTRRITPHDPSGFQSP
ncbi:MAG: amidohydrolase family protein [Fuerstiella sp.]|nr:amidohydrolase family protein [Fuerstiella sp.]